jgi:hypothetical protein
MNYNQEALYYGVASANHPEIAGPCVTPHHCHCDANGANHLVGCVGGGGTRCDFM